MSFVLPPNLIPNDASPAWMSKGDNAWQLTAATMVGLQSVPGLVILYGSIVKKKWAVISLPQTMQPTQKGLKTVTGIPRLGRHVSQKDLSFQDNINRKNLIRLTVYLSTIPKTMHIYTSTSQYSKNIHMSFALPPNLIPNDASPAWMSKGDNAWQLTAATMVGLQSVPGLVILYGSIVKKKWAVNSCFMALFAFAAVLVCWVGWAYQMSFGSAKFLPFVGKPSTASLRTGYLVERAFAGKLPNATMVFFQFVFAAITLILIAGALLGRMNFYAWMVFVPVWLTCSYTVGAYSIWCPSGWLAQKGIIDYSGGYVIHLSSGVAGYTAAYWVGPRQSKDRERFPPNNILLMLLGAGLLWMGWTGFNGGDPYMASRDASLAVLNTHVCAAMSLLTWLVLDIFFFAKPSVIGATQGMITGLVCITPAAGVVQGWAAIIMGLLSGSIPWFTMMVVHKQVSLLKNIDDTMAVFHTHAVAGSLGGILTGFFAEPRLNRIFLDITNEWQNYIGLAYGFKTGRVRAGFNQMGIQLVGILFVVVWNVVITSLICCGIRVFIPLRLSEEELEIGDEEVHGESAYVLWG